MCVCSSTRTAARDSPPPPPSNTHTLDFRAAWVCSGTLDSHQPAQRPSYYSVSCSLHAKVAQWRSTSPIFGQRGSEILVSAAAAQVFDACDARSFHLPGPMLVVESLPSLSHLSLSLITLCLFSLKLLRPQARNGGGMAHS